MSTPTTPTIEARVVRVAPTAGQDGWAVSWGRPRRLFRQVIWFPSRDQADLFAASLRAGDEGGDVQRLLLKAWGRALSITAAERGRLGGPARAAALSPERRLEISRKASAARWAHRTAPATEQIDAPKGGQS